MATVISHFYNESYLLPFWLKHHTQIFEHGILIDYASTDRSVEICKELAPNWEVRQSANPEFGAASCDSEVMEIERTIPGWKMALNTTEFLCAPNLDGCIETIVSQGLNGAMVRPFTMVDSRELRDALVDPEISLTTQRHFGLPPDHPTPWGVTYDSRRSRLIHCHADGAYELGRHETRHADIAHRPDGMIVLWFGFSPWTTELRSRRLQIQKRIPSDDKKNGLGVHHFVTENELESRWAIEAPHAIDLMSVAEYAAVMA